MNSKQTEVSRDFIKHTRWGKLIAKSWPTFFGSLLVATSWGVQQFYAEPSKRTSDLYNQAYNLYQNHWASFLSMHANRVQAIANTNSTNAIEMKAREVVSEGNSVFALCDAIIQLNRLYNGGRFDKDNTDSMRSIKTEVANRSNAILDLGDRGDTIAFYKEAEKFFLYSLKLTIDLSNTSRLNNFNADNILADKLEEEDSQGGWMLLLYACGIVLITIHQSRKYILNRENGVYDFGEVSVQEVKLKETEWAKFKSIVGFKERKKGNKQN